MNPHQWYSNWKKALGEKEKRGCPSCKKSYPAEFNFCPICGRILR